MSEIVIRDVLIRFFEQEFGLPPDTHERTPALFSSGLLDSFALATVLAFLHERFEATVAPEDLIQSNFDSLDAITSYVLRVTSVRQA